MHSQIKTTIIIVTFCSEDDISSCLDVLEDSVKNERLRCIVVDNASNDNTVEIIKRKYKWVNLIENKKNVGYGKGLNLGLERVETDYVLFMNPDVVFTYDNIKILEVFMDGNERVGISAPSILRGKGDYQISGNLTTPASLLKNFIGIFDKHKEILPDDAPFITNWLCGAILLCRTAVIKNINGFDPIFFLYFEETDLCQMVVKSGYELWAVGESKAYHVSNSSARKVKPELELGGCLYEHYYPSRFYYIKKHFGFIAAYSVDFFELLSLLSIDFLRFILKKQSRHGFRKRRMYSSFKIPDKRLY